MQLTWDSELNKRALALFARGGEGDYMMRSEKRPGYRAPEPPKRRTRKHRKKLDFPFVCLTFLLLILLYPVGLILLWVRKIPWLATTKLVLTLAFAFVFVLVASFALTVPVGNDTISRAQVSARQSLANVGTNLQETWAKADVSPEHMLKNAQDIAGHSIQLVQKGLSRALPVLAQNANGFADNTRAVFSMGTSAVVNGTKALMYKANLMPTPEPTPEPTPAPTQTPMPTNTEAPSPAPELSTNLMVWYAPGDSIYHVMPDCEQLMDKSPQPMSVTDAVNQALMPCGICAVPEALAIPAETPEPASATATPAAEAGSDGLINTINGSPALPGMSIETQLPPVEPSPDPSLLATPAPTKTPAPTPSPTPIVLPAVKPVSEAAVYYTSNGKYYHTAPNCGSMRGAKPHTFKEALDRGLKQCSSCGAPDPELMQAEVAVWSGADAVFHITDECEKLAEKYTLMTLDQAMLEEGETGCSDCGANLYVEVAKRFPADTPVPAAPMGN